MKQTEIGLIPDDWEVKEIKDFADVTTGDKNTQDAEENGKYPFYVRSPIVERINKFSYDTEGVITAGDGVGTGKVFHYAKGKFGLHQRAYLIYNFKNTDPKYFYYNFSKNFYERVHSMTAKSSVDSVRREMITKMQIPIPPTLAEQQRIAKALSDVDALISTTEKLIQKKKNIKQGAMQNLLTGKKRLPGFAKSTTYKQTELGLIPEDWEVKTLGELGSFKNGISKPSEDFGFGSPFVNLMDIFGITKISETNHLGLINSNIIEQNTYSLKEGDVLFVRSSVKPEGVGLTTVIKKDLDKTVYSGFILRFREIGNELTTDFKEYVFYNKGFRDSLISSSTVSANTNINQPALKNLIIVYPSSKEEQTALATVLSSMDKEIETLNTKLEKYRNLKTAMMQQLLTGKIRLV
ncbi:MAG: restriction endonuclease subunit S [Spirochaetia bacterium]|nr:restriction endonuclease subunit S [Spirochaetia bacterium]